VADLIAAHLRRQRPPATWWPLVHAASLPI